VYKPTKINRTELSEMPVQLRCMDCTKPTNCQRSYGVFTRSSKR